tara:strand:+ start:225 stop:1292 length:1068 start_codon:yes stop_codon:yes gene_type:complete
MAYTIIDDPSAYFQTKIYTGNGTNNTAITFDGNSDLQPDWLWIKNRSEADQSHALFNSVRGATLRLTSNGYGGESTENTNLDSFDSDGFTVDNELIVNGGSDLMVAWGWKTGTAFSNDASATSVGGIDSAGSVSTDAGFGLITYTGTGSGATVAHGLGVTPTVIFYKRLSGDGSWVVQSTLFTNRNQLVLNGNDVFLNYSSLANIDNWSSSVFTLGTNADMNADGIPYLAYCFANVKGYSKFSTYTGNGEADNGPFVYTGFKPAWLMVKRTDSADQWMIVDNETNSFNEMTNVLRANATNATESSPNSYAFDFLSNGFKLKDDDGKINANNGSYFYMAFAHNPFVTSTGVPTTAR